MDDGVESRVAGRSLHQPHPVDVHVGTRITITRKLKRVSQTKLAEAIGLTFQQIQKYEKGSNRVSASTLYQIARALNVEVSHFFEELPGDFIGQGDGPIAKQLTPELELFMTSREGLRAMEALCTTSPRVRRTVIGLINSLNQGSG